MDLLVSLADNKSKAITYRENNYKIKKILSIQNRRMDLLSNVETIKEQLIRWRKMTKIDKPSEK